MYYRTQFYYTADTARSCIIVLYTTVYYVRYDDDFIRRATRSFTTLRAHIILLLLFVILVFRTHNVVVSRFLYNNIIPIYRRYTSTRVMLYPILFFIHAHDTTLTTVPWELLVVVVVHPPPHPYKRGRTYKRDPASTIRYIYIYIYSRRGRTMRSEIVFVSTIFIARV